MIVGTPDNPAEACRCSMRSFGARLKGRTGMGQRWTNFEAWARDRLGVTVDDVVAQYRKEGLLLSDVPNEQNCWEVSNVATWDGNVPPLIPAAAQRRALAMEDFLATWDGSIGAMVYPDGREVRMLNLEGDRMVKLMDEDLLPGEAALTSVDDLFSAGCCARFSLGFALKPLPE